MARTAGKRAVELDNYDAAKAAHKKALEVNDKAKTDATKKALEGASAKLKHATEELNRHRFVTTTAGRANQAIDAMRNLERAFDPKTYKYSAEEAKTISEALDEAAKSVKAAITRALAGGGDTAKPHGLSFEK